MPRCTASTRNGAPCRNPARPGSETCAVHERIPAEDPGLEDVVHSPAFEASRRRARAYLQNPEQLQELLEEADRKATEASRTRGPLDGIRNDLKDLLRLLQAWRRREYRSVPWNTVVMIAAAVLYFVNPFDAMPDFVPGVGYVDDVAILSWVLLALRADLDRFRLWERDQPLEVETDAAPEAALPHPEKAAVASQAQPCPEGARADSQG